MFLSCTLYIQHFNILNVNPYTTNTSIILAMTVNEYDLGFNVHTEWLEQELTKKPKIPKSADKTQLTDSAQLFKLSHKAS